jgi:hypothetical protein
MCLGQTMKAVKYRNRIASDPSVKLTLLFGSQILLTEPQMLALTAKASNKQ